MAYQTFSSVIELIFCDQVHRVLKPGGVDIVNIIPISQELVDGIVSALEVPFSDVQTEKVYNEDGTNGHNTVVFATKQ